MIRRARTFATTFLLGALLCKEGLGQSAPATILQLDIENWVQYIEDTADFSKFATNPNLTPASAPRNFASHVGIADIVAINGQPVKGTMVRSLRNMNLSRAPNPGQAIGDAARGAFVIDTFEILNSDGDAVGTIITSGFAPGPPAPGAPLSVTQGNFAIVGGTGAFLGARGQNGQAVTAQTVPLRAASITEDPANRRQNGGGRVRWVLHVIPLERPEITITANGPAVTHSSDFTLVTASKPAAVGELLSLFMTGLGPTRPGVDPRQSVSQSGIGRDLASERDCQWNIRRSVGCGRLPRCGRRIPVKLPRAGRHVDGNCGSSSHRSLGHRPGSANRDPVTVRFLVVHGRCRMGSHC